MQRIAARGGHRFAALCRRARRRCGPRCGPMGRRGPSSDIASICKWVHAQGYMVHARIRHLPTMDARWSAGIPQHQQGSDHGCFGWFGLNMVSCALRRGPWSYMQDVLDWSKEKGPNPTPVWELNG